MTGLLTSRFIPRRGVLVAVAILVALLAVGSPDRAFAQGQTFTPNPGQEFNTLSAAGNTLAGGIWSNGTTMWIADSGDDKIYAYNLATKQRDSAKDITTLSAAGNTDPTGIWSDGTTMWVADYNDRKLYAYALADGTRQDGTGGTTDREITLHTANGQPRGISSDGTTLWAVGFRSTEAKIYAYNLSTKARDGAKDVTLDGKNLDVLGVWHDGATLWTVQTSQTGAGFLHAYNTTTSQATRHHLPTPENSNSGYMWSNSSHIWVTDANDDKLYAYNIVQTQALVSNITETTGVANILGNDYAQQFTTGLNQNGYTLTSVELDMSVSTVGTTAGTWTVSVHASSNGQPGSRLATLNAPGTITTGANTFTHTGLDLAAATSYFVVLDVSGASNKFSVRDTASDNESGEAGWSLNNVGHRRGYTSTGAYTTNANALKMRVNGLVTPVPDPDPALVSNFGKGSLTWRSLQSDYAQQFRTGPTGYTLTSVELDLAFPTGREKRTFTVAIHASSGGLPGSSLATLTPPATFGTSQQENITRFIHAGLDLSASTDYFVVIDVTSTTGFGSFRNTDSDDEDSAAGWTISNIGHQRLSTATTWNTNADSRKIRISGTANPIPKPPVPERWTLAGNLGEATASTVALGTYDVAQRFTTGSNPDGYTVTSVELGLSFATASRASFRVAVHEDDNGQPGDRLGILGIQWQRYWADQYKWRHHGIALEPSTSYFLVLDSFSAGSGTIGTTTAGNTEGEGRQTLANEYLRRARAATGAYSKIADSRLKLRINGDVNHGPEDLILTVSPTRITEGDEPTTLTFTVTIGEARDKDYSFSVNHGKGYGEVYSCPGRRGNTNYRYYRSDCPPLAHGPNDWLHWTIPSQPRDYSIQGHAIGFTIPAGQTSVTDTYIITPYDDEKEEGEEYIFFIPESGKYPTAQLILANREPAFEPTELTGLALAPVPGEPTQLAVSWNTVADAARYDVRWKTVSGEYGDAVETTGTSYTITGLTADTNYTVTVAAVSEDDVVLAHGTATGPFWPVTVTAVEGRTDAVDVSWEAVEGAFHYFIRVNGGQKIEARDGRTSRRIAGLEADTEYTFALEAVSAMRDGFETLAERAVTGSTNALQPLEPGALEGLTVHPVGGETTKLAVAWHAVSDADKYLVKWKAGSADYTSGETAESARHTISGLTAGTAYTVQVTAIDTGAEPEAELAAGEASGATLAAMGAVSVAAVAGNSDSLDVSWPAVPGATRYVVAWKTGNEVYRAFASSETEATRGRITGLEAETAYTVRVTARHTIGGVAADGDSAEGSGTTNAPSANSPAAGAPSISGTAQVGRELNADTSGISDADGLTNAGFSYQWLAGGSDISGATSNTYTLVDGDVGKAITVTVSFTDDAGNDEELTSAATAAVIAANTPASGAPTISGTAQVGETLTAATSGISDADGLTNASFSYRWLAGGSDISGATSNTYTPVDGDVGKAVKVTVAFTDDAGHAEELTSAATAAVIAANSPAAGAPSISGTAQVGQELSADTSGISDADGLTNASFSYQWSADGSNISGATGSSYTPVAGDVGKAIKVTVAFTDDAGHAEELTSAATAAVVAEDPQSDEAADSDEQQSDTTPAVSFVLYYDPNAGDAAVDRYTQAVALLQDAGIAYSEVIGDVQDDVDRLAGVTNSVIPRFFLGDPTEEGWVSETKVNNGGLRWLKGKVAELSGE